MRNIGGLFATRISRGILVGLVLLAVVLAAGQASAQEVVLKNIYYLQPPADGSGLIGSWGSEPIGHLGFHFGVMADRAEQPLEWTDPEDVTHILIFDQIAGQGQFGFGILDRINLSVALPYAFARTFEEDYRGKMPQRDRDTGEIKLVNVDEEWADQAMGDLRFQAKYIFRNREFDKWGLAAMVELGVPSGDKAQFVSDEQVTISPRGIFDIGNTWWSYVLNVAYKYYPESLEAGLFDLEGGNELILSTGVTFRVLWGLEFIGEIQSRTLFEALYSNSNVDYAEGIFALRSTWLERNPIRLTLGSGFGILDGVGTPLYRVFLGFDVTIKELGLPPR